MDTTSEKYILNRLTKNLTALVIQSTHEIENNLKDYFHELFVDVVYIDKYSEIKEYLKKNIPDYIFLDLQTSNIEPFKLVEEIRYTVPKQIIIAISSIKDSDILINCIDHNISSFLCKPLNLTIVKDKIIRCLEYLVINDPAVIFKTKSATLYETAHDAIAYLIANNNLNIELINHYKGVPLIRHAYILDMDNNSISIKIKDIQRYILEYFHHAIISSRYLSYDIYAYIQKIDAKEGVAVFNRLSFIKSYVHHRKYIRIIPDTFFYITLIVNNKRYKCTATNLSIRYALISLPKLFDNFKINDKIQLILSFKLNHLVGSDEFQSHTIQTPSIVHKIIEKEDEITALFHFELGEKEHSLLEEYIHARSLALIKEFKRNNIPQ